MRDPFTLTNGELVHELVNASARAGVSGSGLVIDLSGSDDLNRARYLQRVVLARLDFKAPPFKPGDKVQAKDPKVIPSDRNQYPRCRNKRDFSSPVTIKEVHYFGLGYHGELRWDVIFAERNDVTCDKESYYDQDGGRSWYVPLFFQAEDFTKCQ